MPSSADHIIRLYRQHAASWDKQRSRHLFEQSWLDRFISLMPKSPAILDLGCGAGDPIARYLIEQGCGVTGIDTSPPLLALCRERFPTQQWLHADMRALSLNRRFDGILAWDSFFHLTHAGQREMFPVFRAHAAEGAALMFTSGPDHGEAIGTFEGEPLYHASLSEAEYRALLAKEGFEVVAHTAEDAACGGHTVWLAQKRRITEPPA